MPLFYRSFERTTPILFEKLVTKSVDDAFMREKRELFDKATTLCLPSVIRMGRDLREEDLQQHVSFFREKLVGLPSRLPSIYSCYRYFAKEVREGRLVDQRHFVLIDFSLAGKLYASAVKQTLLASPSVKLPSASTVWGLVLGHKKT